MDEVQYVNLDFLQPKNAWEALSQKEKADVMKVAVRRGITDLATIRQMYNEFAEGGNLYGPGGDTSSEALKTPSLSESKRLGVMVGIAPFVRPKGYIGGTPAETRDKYWQTDTEMRILTDSVANQYGINPDLLRSRLDHEGFTDERVADINAEQTRDDFKAPLGEELFKKRSNPYVATKLASEEFGLDDVADYINNGTVNLINERWGDGLAANEKGRDTNVAVGDTYGDNIGIMAATLKAMREQARKDFPWASDADLDRYAQAYYNRGIAGGKKWVQNGAKGYKINKHSDGGNLFGDGSYMDKAKALIKSNEGWKSTPYKDAPEGKTWRSVGYGFNDSGFYDKYPEGISKHYEKGITKAQAEEELNWYLNRADSHLRKMYGSKWDTFTDGQKAAILDTYYQRPASVAKGSVFYGNIMSGKGTMTPGVSGYSERNRKRKKAFLGLDAEPYEVPTALQPAQDNTFVFNPYILQQQATLPYPEVVSTPPTLPTFPSEAELEYQRKQQEAAENRYRFNMAMNVLKLLNGEQDPAESFLQNFMPNPSIPLFDGLPEDQYAKGGRIHIKPENRGKFTALKKRTGKSASWFKAHGTPAQRKMATFALNARKWKHGLGGNLYRGGGLTNVILGPRPGVTDNEDVRGILSWLPYTSTAIDIDNAAKDPSAANLTWAGISTGLDALSFGLASKIKKGIKAVEKAITPAEKEAAAATKRAERAKKVYDQADNYNNYRRWQKAEREAFEKNYVLNNQVDGLYKQLADEQWYKSTWLPIMDGHGGIVSQGAQTIFEGANTPQKALGGNLFAPGGDITYGAPHYLYDENGQLVRDANGKPVLNYNATLSDITIIPDSQKSPADRNEDERFRARTQKDYDEHKQSEWAAQQANSWRRSYNQSGAKKVEDFFKGEQKDEWEKPTYFSVFDGSLKPYGEFFGALAHGLQPLSPSQHYGAAADALQGKRGYFDSLFNGNSGFFTDKYAEEHPWISLAGNMAGDIATGAATSRLLPVVERAAATISEGAGKAMSFLNSPMTGNWTTIGNKQYRFKPGYVGMNGTPIESRNLEKPLLDEKLYQMLKNYDPYAYKIPKSAVDAYKLPELQYESPELNIDFTNLTEPGPDNFLQFLQERVGKPLTRKPIRDTEHGKIYKEGFSFVDDEGREVAHVAGNKKGGNVWVESSFVDPEYRYQGIGPQMYYDFNDDVFARYGTTLHSDPYQRLGSTGVGMSPSNRLWKKFRDQGMSKVEGEGLHRYDVMADPTQTRPLYREPFQEGTPAAEWAKSYGSPEESESIKDIGRSLFGSKLTEHNVDDALTQAKAYKDSEGYRNLIQHAIAESEDMGIGGFPEEVYWDYVKKERPQVIFESRPDGHIAAYNRTANTLRIDPDQVAPGEQVPYHEGLHWQRVGSPDLNIGPLYDKWVATNFDGIFELEDLYRSPEWNRFMARKKAEEYARQKVNKALYESVPEDADLRQPGELPVYGLEAGKALGIEPFAPYPGYEKAIRAIDAARKYDNHFWDVKAGKKEEVENAWKILTGNYIPSLLLGTAGAATLTKE